MDDKEILHRVIKGFELIPAKQGFGHPYVTKTGAATSDLAGRINVWIKHNFPQSHIIASYEGVYKTINFRKVMAEHLIFEHLIKHLIFEEEFLPLQKRSFVDHLDRTELFVKKLEEGDPIDLTNGKSVVINYIKINEDVYNKDNFKELIERLPKLSSNDKITFYSGEDLDSATPYKITAFAKTSELGGKGKGGTLKPEKLASGNINNQLAQIGKPITIDFNGQLYEGATELLPAKGNRKADFYFNSTPNLFISYKQGSTADKIIGYSVIVVLKKEDNEADRFVKAVQARNPDFKNNRIEYAAPVKDLDIARKALYGKNFTEGSNYGEDNIQGILQGNTELVPTDKKGIYTLKASKVIASPEVPQDEEYAPFYNARYANDRSQFGIPNSRFGIIPGGARKNAKVLNIK